MIAAALLAVVAAAAVVAPAPAGPSPVRRVDTDRPVLALTFDACATRKKTYGFDRRVYDVIKAEHVPATVFVSGRWIEAHPAEAEELAHDELIELGSHTYDHPHLTRLSARRIGQEVDRTEAMLARLGKKSVALRPPFGDWNRRVVAVVAEHGLPTVLWDVVSGDPAATSAASIVRHVVPRARAGSIVIFHINARRVKKTRQPTKTAEALPVIVRELRAKGLSFVHVSELLGLAHRGG